MILARCRLQTIIVNHLSVPFQENMDVSVSRKRKYSESGSPIAPPLRWTNEIRKTVATYVNVNFPAFKALNETGGSKMDFLRKMRDELQLQCTDKQLKNAFETLMRKYKYVRDTMNSSGLSLLTGETNLQKEWILHECPYYEILDEVMGESPKVAPPRTLNSTAFGQVGDSGPVVAIISSGPDISMDMTIDSESAISPKETINTTEEDLENYDDSDVKHNISKISKFKLARGLVMQLKKDAPINALRAFAAIIKSNAEHMKEVETNKLQLEKEKFMFTRELADRKLKHKAAKLTAALKTKEMEHRVELEKIKTVGEIEMQKLQLQIELEKLCSLKQP